MAAAARPRARQRRQVLPAGVRGARGAAAARVPALLHARALSAAATLRVPPAAAAAAAHLGHAGVRQRAAAHARALRPAQARALPEPGRPQRQTGAARRVQPVHEQRARDPLSSVPTKCTTAATRRGQTSQVSQPAEQNPRPRAAVRVPGGGLRPPVLAVGRADAAHPDPHGPEAVPVPHLHALVQPVGPPDDARAHAHGRKAVRVRRVRPQVRALGREEAARQGAPEAAAEARARRRAAP